MGIRGRPGVLLALRNANEYCLRPQALSIHATNGGRHARPPPDANFTREADVSPAPPTASPTIPAR